MARSAKSLATRLLVIRDTGEDSQWVCRRERQREIILFLRSVGYQTVHCISMALYNASLHFMW